jgi:tRNA threonylcarbamoyladenosine biosynthesis protein TsaB
MISLTQIAARHGCLLVLDAASRRAQVGLLRRQDTPVWRQSEDDAGKGLFAGVEQCLRETGLGVEAIEAFAFCDGPGSMLGVRTAAMAIRTWQALAARPAYHYSSLALLATNLARSNPGDFSVIADARREEWHVLPVRHGIAGTAARVPRAELAASTETLFLPSALRSWSPPPRAASDCAYDLAALFEAEADAPLFAPTDAPDGFQSAPTSYRKWSAQVHSLDSIVRP